MEKEIENLVVIAQLLAEKNRQWENTFGLLQMMVNYLHKTNLLFIEELINQAKENKMSILSDPSFKERVVRLFEQMQRSLERSAESPIIRAVKPTVGSPSVDPLKQESNAMEMLCPNCFSKIFMNSDAKKVICPYCDALLEIAMDDEGQERLEKEGAK